MLDNLIRAWIAAADPDFGGSLDFYTPVAPRSRRIAGTGVRYCYPHRAGYQVKIPGIPSKMFYDLNEARAACRAA
jgi:hypothetical protein